MSLIKCPRCELNYIQDSDKVCDVCRRDMCGDSEKDELLELCAQCGEHPSIPGDDLCVLCKKELKFEEGEAVKAMMGESLLQKEAMNGITSVSPMDVDEIVIDDVNPPPDFDMDEDFDDELEDANDDAQYEADGIPAAITESIEKTAVNQDGGL